MAKKIIRAKKGKMLSQMALAPADSPDLRSKTTWQTSHSRRMEKKLSLSLPLPQLGQRSVKPSHSLWSMIHPFVELIRENLHISIWTRYARFFLPQTSPPTPLHSRFAMERGVTRLRISSKTLSGFLFAFVTVAPAQA
jgi:hypothetical protein